MKILAVDTATLAGSVALTEDDQLLGEVTLELPRKHSERLMPSIAFLLEQHGLKPQELDGLAVDLGPGSFTGLRVGLATMKGLAFSLNKPLVGINSLEVLVENAAFAFGLLAPVLDARKGQVFTALFRGKGGGRPERESEDWAIEPEKLAERISEPVLLFGEGARVYRELLRGTLGERARFAPAGCDPLRALFLARLAWPRLLAGEGKDPDALTPRYLRLSDAERLRLVDKNRVSNL
ncbi:MAG: tRNA (adenosine(37)-N6)-threonylcarbamoyltransferase complex dimerization subunit type 1 TsaB [Deltaproteobacteria bacterium RBG_13_61_14]|nr:MAG: tRNA (adenosine(37)-N6)-threonylcarbamoyltransferase complex dimerization subunit type 1 TsaB [Deltaproteobacteria bacterium RBG_13_61_14]